MTSTEALTPSPDPTLAVAERQLAVLGEMVEMSLAVCRAGASASIAASNEARAVVSDTAWQSQVDRTHAMVGAKAVAEAFQKLSRSLRLTLKLEMQSAETLRDILAGVITHSAPRGKRSDAVSVECAERPRAAGASSEADALDRDRSETDYECLTEFDQPDRFSHASFRDNIEALKSDIDAASVAAEALSPSLTFMGMAEARSAEGWGAGPSEGSEVTYTSPSRTGLGLNRPSP